MRRQLAERPQLAGVTLRPVVEVEDLEAAAGCPVAAGGAVRRPAVGTFAFIARRAAPVSPAIRAFVARVEQRLERLGELILYHGATSAAGPEQFPAPAPDGLT